MPCICQLVALKPPDGLAPVPAVYSSLSIPLWFFMQVLVGLLKTEDTLLPGLVVEGIGLRRGRRGDFFLNKARIAPMR